MRRNKKKQMTDKRERMKATEIVKQQKQTEKQKKLKHHF